MFDFNPMMVYMRSFFNKFRQETEKQQASAMMKSIAAKWDSGEQVTKEELERLNFMVWVVLCEEFYDEHEDVR